MAVCVAVIARDNYPLYIRTAEPDHELKFHYIAHTSLDVIEEKLATLTKTTSDMRELYLGILYPTEDYKVYGYVTNTKIKFVVVVDASGINYRDTEMRAIFRKLHHAYSDVISNPFYTPETTITSP
ncbi:Trafficking protein particle complex subunit 2-like protein [Trichoplax sp. H2]|uniref:Trafficking protein particle complex subunit 2-like protein n=1 Tax=Trichoplax adhaerens TaxID=10228 RepID=B3S7G1_TRIAD|nr:hypothetical protein TRIADDRAFT_50816 [Trichoplax adhaerens]EDV21193.1 hypothetical protein TRIADDRAFT_50816 [Trichoplax adhaerens]RDD47688.1 Trafficking protein particle complex subunit 2-like protein [Trichoplax sp. H2]|eukprot:XP_002116160.1 hypothetical protein TRIADDRAFT_50816 [Trichoplax adhaerens]